MKDISINAIRTNLEDIKARIAKSAISAGRDPSKIKLVVVSKAKPVEIVEKAYQAGARLFGENYPEETVAKAVALKLRPDVEWHMIGHLQSRKIPLIVEYFNAMHSLDSLHLAEKMNNQLGLVNKKLPVLLEFNVGGEDSKFGWAGWNDACWNEALPDLERILGLTNLEVKGLMTMPPQFENYEEVRPYFVKLRKLLDFLSKRFSLSSFSELSMGTSADFEIAVQEGATIVRIGQAILGARPPK
jgi:pyridoxal phosphate enzyme (YggS family)